MREKETSYNVKVAMKHPADKVWTCMESVCSQYGDYYPMPEGGTILLKPRRDNGLPRILISVKDDGSERSKIDMTVSPRNLGTKTYNRVIADIRAELEMRYGQRKPAKQHTVTQPAVGDTYFTTWKFNCTPNELKAHIGKVMKQNPDWKAEWSPGKVEWEPANEPYFKASLTVFKSGSGSAATIRVTPDENGYRIGTAVRESLQDSINGLRLKPITVLEPYVADREPDVVDDESSVWDTTGSRAAESERLYSTSSSDPAERFLGHAENAVHGLKRLPLSIGSMFGKLSSKVGRFTKTLVALCVILLASTVGTAYGFIDRGNQIDILDEQVTKQSDSIDRLTDKLDSLQSKLDEVEPQRQANEEERQRLDDLSKQLDEQKTQQDQRQAEQDQRQQEQDQRQSDLDVRESNIAYREEQKRQREQAELQASQWQPSSSGTTNTNNGVFVHRGAYCTPEGATGISDAKDRNVLKCAVAKGGRLRWMNAF